MKKIKILFTIPNFDTAGSGKHMVDLIRKLDTELFEPYICCAHEKGAYFKEVEKLGYHIFIRELSPGRKKYFKAIKQVRENAKFFKENHFDMIHSFHWKSDWFEPLAARMAGIPWIYTKKSMAWHKHWTIRNKLASFVFILNPEMADVYPISKENSKCVGLGPDVDEVIDRCNSYDKEEIKTSLGIQGKKVILCVANIVPVKNIDLLIEGIHKIENRDNFHVFIVGDRSHTYAKNLHEYITKFGLEETITLTGKVLDVEKYITIADLYIQPTSQYGRSEASGVACMEACAAGLPAIGTDVAGLRFVIGDQNLLFKPDDVNDLALFIERYINLPEEKLKEIGYKLQQRMYHLFHMPIVAKDHEVEYKRIAQISH